MWIACSQCCFQGWSSSYKLENYGIPPSIALYYLFKDSPARRSLFFEYTMSQIFSRKFCIIRWVENTCVAERSLQLIPLIKMFVAGVEQNKMAPNSKSYREIKNVINDPLLFPKLAFFQMVATEIESFLREYQADAPLIPFLYDDLRSLSLKLIRFLKKDALDINLTDMDLEDKSYYVPVREIYIGFVAQTNLRKVKVTDLQIIEFKTECRSLLIKCLEKLQDRSPLIYQLTKAVSCFDPKTAANESKFLGRLLIVLRILSEKKLDFMHFS